MHSHLLTPRQPRKTPEFARFVKCTAPVPWPADSTPFRGLARTIRVANLPPLPPFPASRPRRLRRDEAIRSLVREHRLHASDLILPVFVLEGQGQVQDVASMPGVQRLSLDRLFPVAEDCL